MIYYCKTCKKGHPENEWKKKTLIHESIKGGSYTILVQCPLGHSNNLGWKTGGYKFYYL